MMKCVFLFLMYVCFSLATSATKCQTNVCDGFSTACVSGTYGIQLRARVVYTNLSLIVQAFGSNSSSTATKSFSLAGVPLASQHTTRTRPEITLSTSVTNGTSAAVNYTLDMTNYVAFYGNYCRASGVAYCPTVDAFSAVKISQRVGEVARCHGMVIQFFTSPSLTLDSVPYIQDDISLCSGSNSLGRARADMLVFNITLSSGKFKVQAVNGSNVLVGTGFMRTCDSSGICILDASLPCIGGNVGKNGYCAVCLDTLQPTADEAASLDPNIFIVYYGTDAKGNTFTSGGKNPMLFEQYSMGSIYSKVMQAEALLKSVSAYVVGATSNFSFANLKDKLSRIKTEATAEVTNLPSTVISSINNLPTPSST